MDFHYGLIFDVDGVIADTEAVNAEASSQVFADLFNVPDVKREDFVEGLGRGAEAYMQAAARVHALLLSEEELARAVAARQENFLLALRKHPLPPFPGVAELMRAALDDSRFTVAIATSSTREKSRAVLIAARIPYQEMVYITGDDVTRKKPDPELFTTAVARLGLHPARGLVIEDAPNGIAAARSAGCRCVAVTNSAPAEDLAGADLVVSSLTEVTLERVRAIIDG